MKRLYEAIDEWMVKYKQNAVKPATYDRLVTSFKLMKNYPIAFVTLDQLNSDDIQDYLNRLVGDGFALSTIKKQFNLLTGFLKYANVKGIVPRPIQNGVQLPSQSSVKKQKKEVEAYSETQQMALRKVLRTFAKPGYGVAMLMMETGARVGEALALSWDDVDWNRRAIRINKTFVRLGNRNRQFIQDSAKSFTSNRVIPLSTEAFSMLKTMYENERDVSGLIFRNDDGGPVSYEAMRYQISQACSEADVPYLGQHVFRHTFATNCYRRGCDVKLLSKLLGHSDVTITYNVYIHLFGDALEEMRKVLG